MAGLGVPAAGVALAILVGGCERLPEHSGTATATPVAQSTPSAPAPPTTPMPAPVRVSVLTEDEQGRVNRALETGRLELPPNMAVLRGHDGTAAPPEGSTVPFLPSTPVATAIVEARPQFTWTALSGATRYTVAIFDERLRQVTKSGLLKTTAWTPPRDLPRGRVLKWQVTAVMKDGTNVITPVPPRPEARFMVLSATTVAEIAKERTRLGTEPVALGLTLAKAGLFGEAERVLESAIGDERYNRVEVRALIARLRAR